MKFLRNFHSPANLSHPLSITPQYPFWSLVYLSINLDINDMGFNIEAYVFSLGY